MNDTTQTLGLLNSLGLAFLVNRMTYKRKRMDTWRIHSFQAVMMSLSLDGTLIQEEVKTVKKECREMTSASSNFPYMLHLTLHSEPVVQSAKNIASDLM